MTHLDTFVSTMPQGRGDVIHQYKDDVQLCIINHSGVTIPVTHLLVAHLRSGLHPVNIKTLRYR